MYKQIMQEIYCPNPKNLFFENPVQPGNELHFGFNPMFQYCGYHYDKEMFYLIDFWNIKENKYFISSYGRLITNTREGGERKQIYNNGYKRVTLTVKSGKSQSFQIHRLVAMAFIPKSIEDIQFGRDLVNHKNLIRGDNYYKNLEWCTSSENTQHAFDNSAHGKTAIMSKPDVESKWGKPTYGEDNGIMCRVTDEQAIIMCQEALKGKPYGECCIIAGLEDNQQNRNILSGILGGFKRKHIAEQLGITRETKKTKNLKDRSQLEPAVKSLLKEGYTIKQITDILPLDDNYDRARMYVSGVKKRMVKNGEL